jgi:peptide/nickel transport system substrate-binding protein
MSLARRSLMPALAALVACSGATAPVTDFTDAPAGPRDMLVYASGGDIGNMISVVSQAASDTLVLGQTQYAGLESDFDCSLKYSPAVVKSWVWGEDSLSLTLTLRDDIKWADGTPVTAEDFAFALDLIGDKVVASPRYSAVEPFAAPPQILSPTEIRFTYREPGDQYTRLAQASGYYEPKQILGAADRASLRTHPLSKRPLPTGPFKLTDHRPNESFVLEPNEAFTGPEEDRARIKRVQFLIVPEYQTRLLKLKRGEVDMMDGINIKDADELRKSNPNLRFERRGYRFMDYVGWNLQDPRFQDKAVRRAMAHAVDVDGMIKRLLTSETGESYGRQAIGTITPELCAVRAHVEPIKKNLAEAKRLLADAGWADTDGDGVLDKGGVKLAFTLMTNRENERRIEAAQLIQADLKQIGIEMTIDTLEFNAMSDRLRKKEFQAVLSGWSAGLFIDPAAMWHSGDGYTFNYSSYANPEVDALIDRGLRTPDPAEAAPIWREMQEKIYDDQPYMFLWWRDEIVAIDDRFQDTQIDILSLMHRLHKWQVPPDRVKYNF